MKASCMLCAKRGVNEDFLPKTSWWWWWWFGIFAFSPKGNHLSFVTHRKRNENYFVDYITLQLLNLSFNTTTDTCNPRMGLCKWKVLVTIISRSFLFPCILRFTNLSEFVLCVDLKSPSYKYIYWVSVCNFLPTKLCETN